MDYSYKIEEFLRESSLDTIYDVLTPELAREYGIDYDYLTPGQPISDEYDDYIYLGSIVAKSEYSDILANENYEVLDICESEDGICMTLMVDQYLYTISVYEIFDMIENAEG